MRVKRVSIKGLFGLFNHDIPLNTEDRITIIHGPNGVGKTTVLKLVIAIFSMQFHVLRSVPYEFITIYFSDGSSLTVQPKLVKLRRLKTSLVFTLKKGKKVQEKEIEPSQRLQYLRRHMPLSVIEDVIGPLERVGHQTWFDQARGRTLSLEEVFDTYGEYLPIDLTEAELSLPSWLKERLNSLPTHFIQTQRLFSVSPEELYEETHPSFRRRVRTARAGGATVEKYAQEMTEKIQEMLRESGSVAASLDRTFPHRLMEKTLPKSAKEAVILEKYEKQAAYRKRLMDTGLIEPEEPVSLPHRRLTPNERKVLWYYLIDVEKKLVVFDKLLSKDIINTRFLYKSFSVNKENGFRFETSRGEAVPLRALSSGEQHELVLSYTLLFKVLEKSLILIDEPELSLHVTWQHKFLEDIKRISELANLDFLIATHSPSIIHNRTDLMVALGD